MVNRITKKGKKYFVCLVCEMVFKQKRQAMHCETRCNKGKECHAKMIKNSMGF